MKSPHISFVFWIRLREATDLAVECIEWSCKAVLETPSLPEWGIVGHHYPPPCLQCNFQFFHSQMLIISTNRAKLAICVSMNYELGIQQMFGAADG